MRDTVYMYTFLHFNNSTFIFQYFSQIEDWDREVVLFKCPNILLEEDWEREVALFGVGKVFLVFSFQKDDDKDILEDWDQEIDLFGVSKVLLN